jgi:hypothetical protein
VICGCIDDCCWALQFPRLCARGRPRCGLFLSCCCFLLRSSDPEVRGAPSIAEFSVVLAPFMWFLRVGSTDLSMLPQECGFANTPCLCFPSFS